MLHKFSDYIFYYQTAEALNWTNLLCKSVVLLAHADATEIWNSSWMKNMTPIHVRERY